MTFCSIYCRRGSFIFSSSLQMQVGEGGGDIQGNKIKEFENQCEDN